MKRVSLLKPLKTTVMGLALGGMLAGPSVGFAETLNEALTAAYNHSGLIQQNRALLRAADEDVAIAAAALRPIINWSIAAGREFGKATTRSVLDGSYNTRYNTSDTVSAGLSFEWLLFDGGVQAKLRDVQKQVVLATRQDLILAEQQILGSAVSAYLSVSQDEQIVAIRENNVALIKEELRAAQDRFEVGEITRTDVALAEARLAAAQAALAAAEGQLTASREEYRAVVGHYPKGLVRPATVPAGITQLVDMEDVAMRTHPQMRKLQHQVAAADLTVVAAKRAKVPRLGLSADYGFNDTLDSPLKSKGGSVALGISSTLYRGGEIPARLRQAIARRDAARAQLIPTRDILRQNVASAYASLRVAQLAKRASEDQIKAAQIAFEGLREEAKLGARTTLDVLNAEQELLNARAGLIQAVTQEYLAAYGILSAAGQLTAKRLGLPVPEYDPAAQPKQSPSIPGLDELLTKLGQKPQ